MQLTAERSRRSRATANVAVMSSLEHLALSIITLFAASVNGALGYGFSSLTVPLALLFLTNRTLNPALVLVEVVLNGYVLFVNRQSLPPVWRRMYG